MLTQVPGGWFVKRLGAKLVVTTTSTVLGGVLLLLPSAGRAGPWAVCAAFAATGVVQGPYMAAAAVVQATAMPAVDSPASAERPLANMIIRLGQQIAAGPGPAGSSVVLTLAAPGSSARHGGSIARHRWMAAEAADLRDAQQPAPLPVHGP